MIQIVPITQLGLPFLEEIGYGVNYLIFNYLVKGFKG